MKDVYLKRTYHPEATTGSLCVIKDGGELEYFKTLERPWRDNKRRESCIKEGVYVCEPDDTGRFQWWQVKDVPNRDNIECHTANYVRELLGCIAFGMTKGTEEDGTPCIYRSKEAFQKFQKALGGKVPFRLHIYEEI